MNFALSELTAISPIDGRYRSKTAPLAEYFSEYALFKYRVFMEIEYLIALAEIPLPQLIGVTDAHKAAFRAIYTNFSIEDALDIKAKEAETNHDIKVYF